MDAYWDHRVLKKDWKNGLISYEICEVFYENNEPHSWIWGKNVMSGDSKEHLEERLFSIKRALEKPILEIVGNDEKLIEVKE